MIKRLLAALALAAALRAPAAAASAGAESFDFLLLDANARAAGLGGAYSAMAEDSNALLYNPAGLAGVCRNEATFMHNRHFQHIDQEYAAVAFRSGIGLNISSLDFGEIPRTTVSSPLGTGTTVGLRDLALGVGYGRRLGRWSVGAGVKYINESIAGYSAAGLAADLGVLFQVDRALTLGWAVQNMGSGIQFQSRTEDLPLLHRLGAAYRREIKGTPTVFALDLVKEKSEALKFRLGAEVRALELMELRLGYDQRNDAGPGLTLGVGWLQGAFRADYALVPFGDLGVGQRFSVSWRWGKDECGKLAEVKPADTDGDGVLDPADKCPDTPVDTVVNAEGCPLPPAPTSETPKDTDGDSVLDTADACPGTPSGIPVDAKGCPKGSPAEVQALNRLGGLAATGSVTPVVLAAVRAAAGDPACIWERLGTLCMKLAMEFEYDRAELKGDFAGQLREIGSFLKENPGARMELQGHTDDRGDETYNLQLSARRAAAVRTYLMEKEGVPEERLKSRGIGEFQPTAENETEEGRKRNRRVMAVLEWPAATP